MTNVRSNVTWQAQPANLEHLQWSPHLEIGIPLIDDEHKRFFDLVASFNGDGDEIRVMQTLLRLNDYVRRHFRDEEALMAACKDPGFVAHRRSHDEFRNMLSNLLERARTMTLDEIADEVERLICGWFSRHIMAECQYFHNRCMP